MPNKKKIDHLFLSIGMMKTGTTWLYSVLGHHPDIYFSYEKEIHYFGHHFTTRERPLKNAMKLKRFKRAVQCYKPNDYKQNDFRQKLMWYADYLREEMDDDWYIDLFKYRSSEKYCADFSNLTCQINRKGWETVKNIANNIKIIVILRHPIKRLFSHVNFHLTFIGKQEEIYKWGKSDYIYFCKKPFIWKNSVYADIIKNLQTFLNENQYRIYFYEEIIKNRKQFIEDIEDFLGIGKMDYPDEIIKKKVNVTKKAPMPVFFPDLFKRQFIKDAQSLMRLGLKLPKEWNDLI